MVGVGRDAVDKLTGSGASYVTDAGYIIAFSGWWQVGSRGKITEGFSY